MQSLISGLIALIMAIWGVAIALIAIQNVAITDASGAKTLVVLKFLGFTSIPLPFGLILAISAALGMVATAILLPLLLSGGLPLPHRSRRNPSNR